MSYCDVRFSNESLLPACNTQISSVERDEALNRVKVVINAEELEFPVEWLKMNCQCEKCFNPVCQSFISSVKEFMTDNRPAVTSVTVFDHGEKLRIEFCDDHISEFSSNWLFQRRLTESGCKERKSRIFLQRPQTWSEKFQVKSAPYQKVTEMDEGFEYFVETMRKDGIFVISECPDRQIMEEFSKKTGLTPLNNHYGLSWSVKNEPKPKNHAFTPVELGLHMDQPYLQAAPHIQYLHCIVQSDTGGDSIMSDGRKACVLLKERFPKLYETLTTVCVEHEDLIDKSDAPIFMVQSNPIIILDNDGQPDHVRINHPCHSSYFNGPIEQLESVIKAQKELYKIIYECSIHLKNKPGDLMVFDNRRVLHGRLAFDPRQARELEGWYSDWDTMMSKLRIVKINKKQIMNGTYDEGEK